MSVDITCAECVERLPEYVSGLGDADERERIERHIQTCDRCRAQLTLWRAIGEAMEQDIATVPPDTREVEGWSRLVAQLPARHAKAAATSIAPVSGEQHMRRDHLRTIELDEDTAHYPDQGLLLPPVSRPARRWMAPVGVIAALLIIALGATLFASHASRRSVPAPGGSTPIAANVQPGPPLPQGVTMTRVTLAAPGEYWATGFVKDQATGQEDTGVILRFSGGKWTQVGDLLQSGHVDGIEMVSPTEGWAWGGDTNETGLLLHISNGAWQRIAAPAVNRKGAPQLIRMSSATDGWLVMTNPKTADGDTTPSTLLHYSNGAWLPVQSPLSFFWDIAAVGPGEAWVLGSDAQSQLIVHLKSGEAIVTLRMPASYNAGDIGLEHLRAQAPSDVWATGIRYSAAPATSINWLVSSTPALYHYDGASWQPVLPGDLRVPTGVQQVQIVPYSGMWATRSIMTSDVPGQHAATRRQIQALYQIDQGVWREVPLPYGDLSDFGVIADASTAGDIWAEGTYPVWTPNANGTGGSGGTYPVLLHYVNGVWTEYGR
jgi:anti-sigma factor RsiW